MVKILISLTTLLCICWNAVDSTGFFLHQSDSMSFPDAISGINNHASLTASPTSVDTDGDSFTNDNDIDDDNDGILDTEEGACTSGSYFIGWWHNNPYADVKQDGYSASPIGTTVFWADGNDGANTDIVTGQGTDETLGSGISSSFHGSLLTLYNVDQGSLSGAISDNDYLEYGFTTTTDFVGSLDRVGFAIGDNSFGEPRTASHTLSIIISSDNFATADTLIKDYNPSTPTTWYEFEDVDISAASFSLQTSTTYLLRMYVYGLPGANADTMNVDDFQISANTCPDSDGDGIADYLDIDSDNDGIADNVEAQTTSGYIAPANNDSDSDGLDDAYDTDCSPCGAITGVAISPVDTDTDGVDDYVDTDSDGDRINDIVEGHDTNGDGTVDGSDSPNANTGLSGGTTDTDGDGLLDGFDNNNSSWDETNGSLTAESHPDVTGGTTEQDWREAADADRDGVADAEDLDDDNDGIIDTDEGCTVNTAVTGQWDSNIPSAVAGKNSGPQNPVYVSSVVSPGVVGAGITSLTLGGLDDFSEDAGYATGTAMAIYGVDQTSLAEAVADGDYFEMEFTTAATWTVPVYLSALVYYQFLLEGTNTVIGGQFSYGLYISDDNFTTSTLLVDGGLMGQAGSDPQLFSSTFSGADYLGFGSYMHYPLQANTTYKARYYFYGDSDGKVCIDDLSFGFTDCPDTDSDGKANHLDLDSDNDGIPDIVEARGVDSDGDGQVDSGTDTDGDGLVDTYDNNDSDGPAVSGCVFGSSCNLIGSTSLLLDTDANGTNDENGDLDGDGLANWIDLDADEDGILDIIEAGGSDSNGDGVGDSSTDADADGYYDSFDADATDGPGSDGTNGNPHMIVDSDGGDSDSRPEYTDRGGIGDTDGDDVPDFLDVDADNDGIYDIYEAQATVGYTPPSNSDDDSDGIDNAYDDNDALWGGGGAVGVSPNNTDSGSGNAIPDYIDTDSDGDGVSDLIEAWDDIRDNDALPDGVSGSCEDDSDGDGYVDCFDSNDSDKNTWTTTVKPPDDDGTGGSTGSTGVDISQSNDVGGIFPNNADGNSSTEPDWRDDGISIFPVEWLSFTVQQIGEDASLSWSTASETNADVYEIERSSDSRSFQRIGEQQAQGTTNQVSTYTFTDREVNRFDTERLYYRLRQIDLDGTFSYSSIAELTLSYKAQLWLRPRPIPASDLLTIAYKLIDAGSAKLEVVSSLGQLVYTQNLNEASGEIQISVQALPDGIYYVILSTEELKEMFIVMVKK